MSDLTDFLLARIAEDEAIARNATICPLTRGGEVPKLSARQWIARLNSLGRWVIEGVDREETVAELRIAFPLGVESYSARHIARHDPARVLAECEAKRRIVRIHAGGGESPGDTDTGYGRYYRYDHACETCGEFGEYGVEWPCATIKSLALPYADHEDFREEWKP